MYHFSLEAAGGRQSSDVRLSVFCFLFCVLGLQSKSPHGGLFASVKKTFDEIEIKRGLFQSVNFRSRSGTNLRYTGLYRLNPRPHHPEQQKCKAKEISTL